MNHVLVIIYVYNSQFWLPTQGDLISFGFLARAWCLAPLCLNCTWDSGLKRFKQGD